MQYAKTLLLLVQLMMQELHVLQLILVQIIQNQIVIKEQMEIVFGMVQDVLFTKLLVEDIQYKLIVDILLEKINVIGMHHQELQQLVFKLQLLQQIVQKLLEVV